MTGFFVHHLDTHQEFLNAPKEVRFQSCFFHEDELLVIAQAIKETQLKAQGQENPVLIGNFVLECMELACSMDITSTQKLEAALLTLLYTLGQHI